ncbi:hypothetical protein [Streptomyces coeruleorubidus]|uniref:hypothetical protein n=1 Tax=Streptomyces coeruleorubidus TaxID=116188 RepID=UPI0033DDA64E
MTADALDYSGPGPLTRFDAGQSRLLDGLPDDPVEVCAVVRTLVIQPADAARLGLPEERIAEKDIRPAGGLLAALSALDPAPLRHPRGPETRVVGTCRHFATRQPHRHPRPHLRRRRSGRPCPPVHAPRPRGAAAPRHVGGPADTHFFVGTGQRPDSAPSWSQGGR